MQKLLLAAIAVLPWVLGCDKPASKLAACSRRRPIRWAVAGRGLSRQSGHAATPEAPAPTPGPPKARAAAPAAPPDPPQTHRLQAEGLLPALRRPPLPRRNARAVGETLAGPLLPRAALPVRRLHADLAGLHLSGLDRHLALLVARADYCWYRYDEVLGVFIPVNSDGTDAIDTAPPAVATR